MTVSPSGFPSPWVFENYAEVLASGSFWQTMGNSAIVGVATSVGVVALGLMASFVLARYSFVGRGAMYSLFAAGLMFPVTVAITLALIFRRWWVWALGAVWVVWMCWSRTYLSAHWISDVIAGLLEGIAVATLVWYAIEAIKDRRARKHQGVELPAPR